MTGGASAAPMSPGTQTAFLIREAKLLGTALLPANAPRHDELSYALCAACLYLSSEPPPFESTGILDSILGNPLLRRRYLHLRKGTLADVDMGSTL